METEGNEDEEWVNRWFRDFDPREEKTETGTTEEEATRENREQEEDGFAKMLEPFDQDKEEAAAGETEREPEEAQKVRTARIPVKPSKEEVE